MLFLILLSGYKKYWRKKSGMIFSWNFVPQWPTKTQPILYLLQKLVRFWSFLQNHVYYKLSERTQQTEACSI